MEIREIDPSGKPAARVSMNELARQAGRGSKKTIDTAKRMPGEKAEDVSEIPQIDPAVVKSTFKMGFHAGYVVTNFEGWQLSEEEAIYLQKAWQPVFDKYIAPRWVEFVIIFNAVGALGTTVFGKVRDQQEWKREQKAEEQKNKRPPEEIR